MKYCTNNNCSQVNPQDLSNFHKDKRNKDGRCGMCKKCQSEIDRQYYSLNSEERKRKRKKRYQDNIFKESENRIKNRSKMQIYYASHKDDIKNYHLMKNYGINLQDFERILTEQHNKCAICGSENSKDKRTTRFHVDHCHKTMKVRGLLCTKCNRAIGLLEDNIVILLLAVKYLVPKHSSQPDIFHKTLESLLQLTTTLPGINQN